MASTNDTSGYPAMGRVYAKLELIGPKRGMQRVEYHEYLEKPGYPWAAQITVGEVQDGEISK